LPRAQLGSLAWLARAWAQCGCIRPPHRLHPPPTLSLNIDNGFAILQHGSGFIGIPYRIVAPLIPLPSSRSGQYIWWLGHFVQPPVWRTTASSFFLMQNNWSIGAPGFFAVFGCALAPNNDHISSQILTEEWALPGPARSNPYSAHGQWKQDWLAGVVTSPCHGVCLALLPCPHSHGSNPIWWIVTDRWAGLGSFPFLFWSGVVIPITCASSFLTNHDRIILLTPQATEMKMFAPVTGGWGTTELNAKIAAIFFFCRFDREPIHAETRINSFSFRLHRGHLWLERSLLRKRSLTDLDGDCSCCYTVASVRASR